MPELTDDHIEELFADLRATELHQVRSPGVAAARSTVRRRRTVQSAAAAVAALAAMGGIAAGLGTFGPQQSGIGTAAAPTASESAATGPQLGFENRERNLQLARKVLGAAAGGEKGAGATSRGNGIVFDDVARGSHELLLACVGPGSVAATVSVGTVLQDKDGTLQADKWTSGPTVYRTPVPCTATVWADEHNATKELAAQVETLAFTSDRDGIMTIRFEMDASATDRAGIAWHVKRS
ncbi:MAG TPA: hypothetical protein VFO77_06210, partial [Actinoplanes sp.]|nr:hypothetical protein [Actinoplanes sp.]